MEPGGARRVPRVLSHRGGLHESLAREPTCISLKVQGVWEVTWSVYIHICSYLRSWSDSSLQNANIMGQACPSFFSIIPPEDSSQEEPGGAGGEPGGARRSQEEPGGVRRS